MLAILRLELGIAIDRDQLELEVDLIPKAAYHLEGPCAEAALLGREDDDPRYGYRPLVVVASATRCTASPYDAMRRLVS